MKLPHASPDPLPPDRPDPRTRPDERKEGGPDFGKKRHQYEKARRDQQDVVQEAEEGPPSVKDRKDR